MLESLYSFAVNLLGFLLCMLCVCIYYISEMLCLGCWNLCISFAVNLLVFSVFYVVRIYIILEMLHFVCFNVLMLEANLLIIYYVLVCSCRTPGKPRSPSESFLWARPRDT